MITKAICQYDKEAGKHGVKTYTHTDRDREWESPGEVCSPTSGFTTTRCDRKIGVKNEGAGAAVVTFEE